MAIENVAGLIVLDESRVRFERYRLGLTPAKRWTSFSVAKSVTSTLVGAAIHGGFIASISDPIARYIPELAGSAYDGVTIEQVLTMTSGVSWNEDYGDPNSDVANFATAASDQGVEPTVSYMRRLPRAVAPGTRWRYNTGETNLAGVLVANATDRSLSTYLSETIWATYGMERRAAWLVRSSPDAVEPGGFGLCATLRDFGRFGQFVLDDGIVDGRRTVPMGWFASATTTRRQTDEPGQGYGYQWWTRSNGTFAARGIFGQLLHIDPARRLVIAMLSNWCSPVGPDRSAAREAMISAVTAAVEVGRDLTSVGTTTERRHRP